MSTRPVTVLYIDDDPGLARLAQRGLGRRGYRVDTASSSEIGLARLNEGGVDVIVLDHYLPVGTGLDFLKTLSASVSPPPVVYVTASGDTSVAVAALKAGAADYVTKTAGEEFLELLANGIEQALEKARLQHERERVDREIREAKERAEILLHEVNHRVANSLALVVGLIQLQSRTTDNPAVRDALLETQFRISAIAGVHRSLYTSDDVRAVDIANYLSNLLGELQTTLKDSGRATIRLQAQPIHIPTDKAISVGVIVTELVTNAFKYAYPTQSGGEIRVNVTGVSPGTVSLTVEDDGIGWTGKGAPQGTGLGTRIVNSLAESLGADIKYLDAGGCRIRIQFACCSDGGAH
jgi:two-component sensor histidine kinase/CheY-like chemotaxis protein